MRLIDQLRDILESERYEELKYTLDETERYAFDTIRNPNLPIIDVSNIVDYATSNMAQIARSPQEVITSALPPFSECWMEFNGQIGHWGGLLLTVDMRDLSPTEKLEILGEAKKWLSKLGETIIQESAWLIVGQFASVSNINGTPTGFDSGATFIVDKTGMPLTQIRAKFTRALREGEQFKVEHAALKRGVRGLPAQTLLDASAYMAMNIFNVASSFMSCKNIQLVENHPPRYERRQREREKKPPLTKYYTLEIEPMKRILRIEGKSEEVGLKKALHICRGHFAHYTPDKPLFGKVSGRFWIPAHVRGSKEAGEIKKDYRIKTPKI